jgi:hypothetical protein
MIKKDTVSFYIRSDFGEKDCIEQRRIERGDVYCLRYYILKFMQTSAHKRRFFGKLYIPLPKYENIGAFAYA